MMEGLLHGWKILKSLKEERVRSTYLKKLLTETDEQISRTCRQNGQANIEALQLGETLKAAKKILIGEKKEEMTCEGRIDEPFKLGKSYISVFLFFPACHQHVIKGSDWLIVMVMSLCCLTSLSGLSMLVQQWEKIILFTSAGAFFLSGRFIFHKWAISIHTYYLMIY